MELIKYYNIEARSRKAAYDLERNLQRDILKERYKRNLLEMAVEEIARTRMGEGDLEILSQLTYDSGEFEVLYKKLKKTLFRRPNVELVLRTTPEYLLEFQNYLANSEFGIIEAKNVNSATFQFTTEPSKEEDAIKGYMKKLEHCFKIKHPEVKDYNLTRDITTWAKRDDGTVLDKEFGCTGMIRGPVADVIEIRKFLLNGVYSLRCLIEVEEESISFDSS